MELINYWMYGVVAFGALLALRVSPTEDPRFLFRAVLMWPVSILAIAVVLLMDAAGLDLDTTHNPQMFGFRKPTNTEVRGFAVTIFYTEIQVWKKRQQNS